MISAKPWQKHVLMFRELPVELSYLINDMLMPKVLYTRMGNIRLSNFRVDLLRIGNYWLYLKLITKCRVLFKSEGWYLLSVCNRSMLEIIYKKLVFQPDGFLDVKPRVLLKSLLLFAMKYHMYEMQQYVTSCMGCIDFLNMLNSPDVYTDPNLMLFALRNIFNFSDTVRDKTASYYIHLQLCQGMFCACGIIDCEKKTMKYLITEFINNGFKLHQVIMELHFQVYH
jgi:hypothetical protein